MVQHDRQNRRPAAPPETPQRVRDAKLLAAARAWYHGSLAQDFARRLKDLDFSSQIMLFGAGLLVSLLPLLILLSAFARHASMMTLPCAWAWTSGPRGS